MPDTTFEEAKRCPKCGNPGRLALDKPGEKRSRVMVFQCETELCTWFNTGWTVQVNEDGSIPTRKPGLKEAPAMSPSQEAFARQYLEQIRQEDLRGQ